jgi:hypothetical protein
LWDRRHPSARIVKNPEQADCSATTVTSTYVRSVWHFMPSTSGSWPRSTLIERNSKLRTSWTTDHPYNPADGDRRVTTGYGIHGTAARRGATRRHCDLGGRALSTKSAPSHRRGCRPERFLRGHLSAERSPLTHGFVGEPEGIQAGRRGAQPSSIVGVCGPVATRPSRVRPAGLRPPLTAASRRLSSQREQCAGWIRENDARPFQMAIKN